MGDHELGHVDASEFTLSLAVAASSAFPPVFPPLKLVQEDYPAAGMEYITLTDGGIYDNLGANPVFLERNALDYIIVSDAGKPFELYENATESSAGVLPAIIDIAMEQVRGLQFERMELIGKADSGPTFIWFSIDSTEGQLNAGDAQWASSIKTHMKKLKSEELVVLQRHARGLLSARVSSYATELNTMNA